MLHLQKQAESYLNTTKRTESSETGDIDCIELDISFNKDKAFNNLNSSLCEQGESLLTHQGISSCTKKKCGKR